MNIKDVGEVFDLSPETLRYYEKVGAIPLKEIKTAIEITQ